MPYLGFIIWGLVSLVLGAIATLILLLAAALIVPKDTRGRAAALVISGLFPAATLVYLVIAFFAYALISTAIGRPIDFGDSWALALGRGYVMTMIDTPERASIDYKEETRISDVIRIAQSGPIVLGESTHGFFLLDTATGDRQTYDTEAALRGAAAARGVATVTFKDTDDFYYANRIGPFEKWAYGIIGIFPTLGLCWLIGYLVTVRRRGRVTAG